MSTRKAELNRRGFLGGSLLFVAGAVTACSSNPTGAAAKSGGKTTLNVWYHAYGEAGTQQAVTRYATAFTAANPDIAVKVTWVPGDYTAKIYSTLLTADAPDVFEIGEFTEGLARHGQVADLTDIYGDAKSDFAQGDLDYLTVDGKLHGVKMIDDVMMLYYRKSVLAKAGIQPPKTFTELADAAKALTTKDQKGLFISNDGVGDIPALAIWANGGELIDASGKAQFGSDQAVQAVSALKRLHDDKSLLLGYTTDWWDASAFTQNVVPMQWGGLWSMPDISKALGDDFGIMPWPGASGGGAVRVGGWCSMVNAKGKNVEAAKKFVQWLWIQNKDLQKDFAESYGFHVPPRKSVAATADKLQSGSPKDAVGLASTYGKTFPTFWGTSVSSVFNAAAGKIMSGAGDPAKLLSDAASAVQPEIDKQRM